jgi:hypothetical protein
VFLARTNCRTLLHKLDCDQPKTTKELLDITTRHTYGEEAVRAIFVQNDRKATPNSGRGAPLKVAGKGAKRSVKGNKRGAKWRPQRVTVTTSCDEGGNEEANDSNEELVATTERDFKCQVWQPADHFEKLLEVTYPNHAYPIRHKLKECTMMKNYMSMRTLTKDKKLEGDSVGKAAAPFPKEKAVMSIYGGPAPHKSRCKLKLTSRAVNAVSLAAPEYLHWSKSPITFDP